MTGNYNIPAGYAGFNQGYMGGQQYIQPPQPIQPQMQQVGQQRQQQQQSNYSCVPVTSRVNQRYRAGWRCYGNGGDLNARSI